MSVKKTFPTGEQKLTDALNYLITTKYPEGTKVGITLGSGLDWMVELLEDPFSVDYLNIPHCPKCGATGHKGKMWFGKLGQTPVIMLQGRVHYYEGHDIKTVVFLTRLMAMFTKKIILTHAVGGVTKNLEPTDIVGIRSHIGFNCPDPTAGPEVPRYGSEFTPMGAAYSPRLLDIAKQCALEEKVSFHFGVSHFKQGRAYESEAEVEAMRRAGADVATMSTIPEVMAAVQVKTEVLDLALVTNMGAGLGSTVPLSHKEVQETAARMKDRFGRLVKAIVAEMAKLGTAFY